tara:strand:+ start:475 stop:702 length:228 start_codon:yes stop_codon:yes gene_type:complete
MKTNFSDIMTEKDFPVLNKIYDIGRQAEIIGDLAKDTIDKEGEHAKIHCSNVVEWMKDLAEQAQKAIDLKIEASE